jgi:hypothetical protein
MSIFNDDFFETTFLGNNGHLIKSDGFPGSRKIQHKYVKREDDGFNPDGTKKYKYYYRDENGKLVINSKSPEELKNNLKSKKVEITVGTAVNHNGKVYKVKEFYSAKDGTEMAKIKKDDETVDVNKKKLNPTKETPKLNMKKE